MATLLRSGSTGDEVKRLQEILNTQGYGLDVDGVFGGQTKNAVKQYQTAAGLDADGIVGDKTWASLEALGSAASPTQAQQPTTMTTPYGSTYDPAETTGAQADLGRAEGSAPRFKQSQTLTDALTALQQQLGQKPGAYESPYAAQIEQLYEKATSRPQFQYDPNADPLYQMYRDRYTENARRSMQDTMADAAALTGGYGNSYAQTVAQQAYDSQMNGLNEILPQLYGRAYDQYTAEGEELLQRLALAQQMDQTAYGRYADDLADWYNQLAARQSLANDQYNREYGQYADALSAWQADRAFYYQKAQDELAQQNYLAQLAMAGSGSGGSSGGGSRSSGSSKSGGSGSKSSGSVSTGANYKTVLSTAKGLTDSKAIDYVARMVDSGYISDAEADRILFVEMGIDPAKVTGDTSSTTATTYSGGTTGTGTGTGLFGGLASALDSYLKGATSGKTTAKTSAMSHGTNLGPLNTEVAKAQTAGHLSSGTASATLAKALEKLKKMAK